MYLLRLMLVGVWLGLLGIILFLRSLYYKLAKFKNFKLFRATGPVFGTGRPKDSVSGQGRWGGCHQR